MTGERHRLNVLESGYEVTEEINRRASDFISRSIAVQDIIVNGLKDRVAIWVLDNVDEWDRVVLAYSGEPEMARFNS